MSGVQMCCTPFSFTFPIDIDIINVSVRADYCSKKLAVERDGQLSISVKTIRCLMDIVLTHGKVKRYNETVLGCLGF